MKNKLTHFTLIGSLFLAFSVNAADIKNLKAGTLKDAGISEKETTLKVSGQMDASDFFYIFDNLNELTELNISEVEIIAYSGKPLNYTGLSSSPANTLPAYSLTGLTNLSSITLPNNLQGIGKGSLSGTGITVMSVPNKVTTIEDYAFMRCAKLESIEIPESVTSLGERAFAYCPELKTVTISATLQSIPEGLFEACGGLQDISLEYLAQCTEIGPWALAECMGLETLVLPQNSQIINDAALYGTSGIKLLKLPESVSYIGNNAMTAMSALNTLNASDVIAVPELGENVWGRMDKSSVTLVTPNNQTDDYKAAEQWNEFNIISKDEWQSSTQNISSEINESRLSVKLTNSELYVTAENSYLGIVSIYNISGNRIATSVAENTAKFNIANWTPGVYLIVTSKGVAKVSI